MKAILIKDQYVDLCMGYPYEVESVLPDREITLKGSPGRYAGDCFKYTIDGNEIPLDKALKYVNWDLVMFFIFLGVLMLSFGITIIFVLIGSILESIGLDSSMVFII